MNIDKAIALIRHKHPDVQAIYVFGSSGTVYENKESDLDLAMLSPEKMTSTDRWQLAEEIAYLIHRDVDLIDLREASTVLRFQIISSGQRVYCQNPYECDLFETFVYSAYVRFNDERRDLLNDIHQRGNIFNG